MTDPAASIPTPTVRRLPLAEALPLAFILVAFALLFYKPATLLVRDWWNDPEAGHGLLLAPAAVWLAWKKGLVAERAPSVALGLLILVAAVMLRLASELAAELFTMRLSLVMAMGGLVVYYMGLRQALAWWLPFTLLVLSVPLPVLIRSTLALPGHRLFVTEACSGLRSLTALLSLALLMGGIWLRGPLLRTALILAAIPIAVAINGVRVFLTGFLVYFVDPKLGEGFMHITEGWLLFVVS